MNTIKKGLWIALLIVAILTPQLSFFFLSGVLDTENHENRSIAEKPQLSFDSLRTFPAEYEKYYNDTLPFRNQLVRLGNSVNFHVFRDTASGRVERGRDGWLFYTDENDGNPVFQSIGGWKLTDEQLKTIADNLVSSQRVLNSLGTELVLFIAPNKSTIYRDKLPGHTAVIDEETAVDQLVTYLRKHTDIRVVYPKQELMDMRAADENLILYHQLDTHWNQAGGYIGASALMKELGISVPELPTLALQQVTSSTGDLTKMLNITIADGDTDYNLTGYSSLYTEVTEVDADTHVYHTAHADPRSLLVERDSYFSAMANFVVCHFENSRVVHTRAFQQQSITDMRPDIYLVEKVERYIRQLLDWRISYACMSRMETGTDKLINIEPAFDGIEQPLCRIIRQDSNGNQTVVLEYAALREMNFTVPRNVTGTVIISIFDHEMRMIEEITYPY